LLINDDRRAAWAMTLDTLAYLMVRPLDKHSMQTIGITGCENEETKNWKQQS
jgi:hypothetical protein